MTIRRYDSMQAVVVEFKQALLANGCADHRSLGMQRPWCGRWWPLAHAGIQPKAQLLKRKADGDGHLPMCDLTVLDVPPGLEHFEPAHFFTVADARLIATRIASSEPCGDEPVISMVL